MSGITDIDFNKVEVKLADTDDPLASRIEWTPANSGGANFKTKRLEKLSYTKIAVKPTLGAKLFSMAFVLTGLGTLVAGGFVGFTKGDMQGGLFMMAIGAFFSGVGIVIYRQFARGLVFDKSLGRYYLGKESGRSKYTSSDTQGKLSDIHALQILTERVTSSSSKGGSSSYHSFEINLVLNNGKRINVMDHGKIEAIEDNAKELGRFLDVPVWRASYGA